MSHSYLKELFLAEGILEEEEKKSFQIELDILYFS